MSITDKGRSMSIVKQIKQAVKQELDKFEDLQQQLDDYKQEAHQNKVSNDEQNADLQSVEKHNEAK